MTQFQNKNSTPSHPVAFTGLFAALALIFSYVEVLIPFTPAIPGIKLGIANLVIIITLYLMGPKYAFVVNITRIFLAGLLFSGMFGMFYSLAGGILSLSVMVLLQRTGRFSVTGVSVAGGVVHNLGQLLIAAILVGTLKVFIYFPVLLFSGLISGGIIGIIAWLILTRLPKCL